MYSRSIRLIYYKMITDNFQVLMVMLKNSKSEFSSVHSCSKGNQFTPVFLQYSVVPTYLRLVFHFHFPKCFFTLHFLYFNHFHSSLSDHNEHDDVFQVLHTLKFKVSVCLFHMISLLSHNQNSPPCFL